MGGMKINFKSYILKQNKDWNGNKNYSLKEVIKNDLHANIKII